MADAPAFDKATLAWSLPWESDWVTAVAIVGQRLVAGNNLGHILVWDLPEKSGAAAPLPARRLYGHANGITRLVAAPDGRWLLSASRDRSIRSWDLDAPTTEKADIILDERTRAEVAKKLGSKAPPPAPGVTMEVQKAQHVWEAHKDWVTALALSGDGNLLVSGDEDGGAIVWDRVEGKELRRLPIKGWASAAALSADAKRLVIAERVRVVFSKEAHAGVRFWDPATGKETRNLGDLFKQEIGAAAFAPDGKSLALGRGGECDGYGKILLIDSETGKSRVELAGHLNGVTDLLFSADGRYILSSGRDTVVRVWQAEDGKKVAELGKPRGGQFKDWIHAIALSADERWLAAADMAGLVAVYAL